MNAAIIGAWPLVFAISGGNLRVKDKTFVMSIFAFFVFSLVGLSTGYLTGMSREAAVGALVPAVLSLVAGAAVFLFDRTAGQSITLGLSIVGLSISLVLGTVYGSKNRFEYDTSMMELRLYYLHNLEYQKYIAEKEAMIYEYRDFYGLNTEPFDRMLYFNGNTLDSKAP